jgi:hypothetical protein
MLYEIEIHRKDYREPVDMKAVYAALKEAGVDFDPDERRNNISGGEPEEHPEYIYVTGSVGEAVRVINSLGYTTDEDEDEEDDDERGDAYEGFE